MAGSVDPSSDSGAPGARGEPPGSHDGIARRVRVGATVSALAVAVGFAGAIVLLPSPPLLLHETAGAVLLVLLGVALLGAYRERPAARRSVPRLLGSLGALVLMGGLGAALATGGLSSAYSSAPLLVLVPFCVLLMDSLRSP